VGVRMESRLAGLALLLSLGAGCTELPAAPRDHPAGTGSVGPLILEGAVASLEQLAFETLEGIGANDRDRLERLRLTEYQHNQLVWPQLPASRPEANYPVDFAWTNIELRNRRALGRILWDFGGHELALLGVECRAAPERFASFRVLKDCWVSFTLDRREAAPQQFFRYVLDWDGQYKVFRFYDPD